MDEPQDWAPYSSVEDAAKVYLRDPELALEQLRSVVDFRSIKSFIMSRGASEESWGDAVWQEVVLTDGERLELKLKTAYILVCECPDCGERFKLRMPLTKEGYELCPECHHLTLHRTEDYHMVKPATGSD